MGADMDIEIDDLLGSLDSNPNDDFKSPQSKIDYTYDVSGVYRPSISADADVDTALSAIDDLLNDFEPTFQSDVDVKGKIKSPSMVTESELDKELIDLLTDMDGGKQVDGDVSINVHGKPDGELHNLLAEIQEPLTKFSEKPKGGMQMDVDIDLKGKGGGKADIGVDGKAGLKSSQKGGAPAVAVKKKADFDMDVDVDVDAKGKGDKSKDDKRKGLGASMGKLKGKFLGSVDVDVDVKSKKKGEVEVDAKSKKKGGASIDVEVDADGKGKGKGKGGVFSPRTKKDKK